MTSSASILVADDDDISARFLKRLLTREGHHVSVVRSADEVLAACAAQSPDLVLLDLVAPRGHGFDICRRLKEQASTRLVPVVIVTAQSERDDRLKGIMAGADDFLGKPFDPLELHARIQIARPVEALHRRARVGGDRSSSAWARRSKRATRRRRGTASGWRRTRRAWAGRWDSTTADLAALERGGFLHDIGKIAVPDSRAAEGRQARSAGIARHARASRSSATRFCTGLRSLQKVRPIVRHHHERLDGTGYPDGLKNAQVPLLAQIVGIVDVFDALTTDRPYHTAVSRG